jgi:hypothetical protein
MAAVRRFAAIPAVLAAAAAIAACGGGEGAREGATVSVYVGAGLCSQARAALAAADGEAGELRVRAVCLPSERRGERVDLATVGANARRATEDSTAVAYLLPREATIARFSAPILREADIPSLSSDSGAAAMSRTLAAIAAADLGSLRADVGDALAASR